MVIVMRSPTKAEDLERVVQLAHQRNLETHISHGEERTIVGLIGGDVRELDTAALGQLPGVERVVRILQPFKLASRAHQPDGGQVTIGCHPSSRRVIIGHTKLAIIAGPCSVEGREMTLQTAQAVREHGGHGLRGGAFKPRTSPYSFQGLGRQGLEHLAEARQVTGLPVVTEVPAPEQVGLLCEFADVLQVGARNMQNYPLLQEVGRTDRPVLLKRGMSASVEEWLMAAEYVLSQGNNRVILCERGIRTFETSTRNTLDLSAVAVVKRQSHLPVLVDPSHGTGYADLVPSMSLAAIAAGADGLLLEVHPDPPSALCDGGQSLSFAGYAQLTAALQAVAAAVGREM